MNKKVFYCAIEKNDTMSVFVEECGDVSFVVREEYQRADFVLKKAEVEELIEFISPSLEVEPKAPTLELDLQSDVAVPAQEWKETHNTATNFQDALEKQKSGYDIYCVTGKGVIKNPTTFTTGMINYGDWRFGAKSEPKLFLADRGNGKTQRLIEEAHKNNGSILVFLEPQRREIEKRSKEMGKPVKILSLASLSNGSMRGYDSLRKNSKLYVDDFEAIFTQMLRKTGFNGDVVGYSTSLEAVVIPKKL